MVKTNSTPRTGDSALLLDADCIDGKTANRYLRFIPRKEICEDTSLFTFGNKICRRKLFSSTSYFFSWKKNSNADMFDRRVHDDRFCMSVSGELATRPKGIVRRGKEVMTSDDVIRIESTQEMN